MILTVSPFMMLNRFWSDLSIEKVEQLRNAKYVGEFPGKTKNGWTGDMPIAVFYQEEPPAPYTNHYFGLFQDVWSRRLLICDASYIEGHEFTALDTADGIVYSRFRHDYLVVGDQMIDGGWDYVRHSGGPLVQVCVRDGQFVKATPTTIQ